MDINSNLIHICIPSFKEDNIKPTLHSLMNCDADGIDYKISILVNESNESTDEVRSLNKQTIQDIKDFMTSFPTIPITYNHIIFPNKDAGVGLARKTLMDVASQEYLSKQQNGLIVALDADTTVETNYLQSIKKYFTNTKSKAASIFYEHPLISQEIIDYEFHLRYYNSMQHHAGFPFAIHTVGSAMVCTADSYKKKGGMNKRKAGEDFYFMQKFIKDQDCGNIISTTVIPSPRSSDRVPFGTGRAILKYIDSAYQPTTYNPITFELLKELNKDIYSVYESKTFQLPENKHFNAFLRSINFKENYRICLTNTSTKQAFLKRFYQYFDGFTLMKCLHFMREIYPDVTIETASKYYSETVLKTSFISIHDTLLALREEERQRFS